jgi:excisionase family DNA binding protein
MGESTFSDQGIRPREVMSVREVAAYLGLSESKVRQLIGRNAIPFAKLDGQYKFFLPTVQDWLRSITVIPKLESIDSQPALALANDIWNKTAGA